MSAHKEKSLLPFAYQPWSDVLLATCFFVIILTLFLSVALMNGKGDQLLPLMYLLLVPALVNIFSFVALCKQFFTFDKGSLSWVGLYREFMKEFSTKQKTQFFIWLLVLFLIFIFVIFFVSPPPQLWFMNGLAKLVFPVLPFYLLRRKWKIFSQSKDTGNQLLLLSIVGIICFSLCIGFVTRSFVNKKVSEFSSLENQKRGNIIVEALFQYKKETGVFPDDLSVLVPRYLPSIPTVYLGESFGYHHACYAFLPSQRKFLETHANRFLRSDCKANSNEQLKEIFSLNYFTFGPNWDSGYYEYSEGDPSFPNEWRKHPRGFMAD